MKTATVRQLRHDFGSVLDWIEAGEPVEITKRGRIVAVVTPPNHMKPVAPRPDFGARLKRIYGKSILPDNIIVEERAASKW